MGKNKGNKTGKVMKIKRQYDAARTEEGISVPRFSQRKTNSDAKINNNKVIKNKKLIFEDNGTVVEEVDTAYSTKEQQREKTRKVMDAEEEINATPHVLRTKKNKKNRESDRKTVATDKKRKMTDDTQEVQITVKGTKKRKQDSNVEEAEVKDEDIDKFCEELDDEDNEQYENWVKLIEANLKKPIKNKTS